MEEDNRTSTSLGEYVAIELGSCKVHGPCAHVLQTHAEWIRRAYSKTTDCVCVCVCVCEHCHVLSDPWSLSVGSPNSYVCVGVPQ